MDRPLYPLDDPRKPSLIDRLRAVDNARRGFPGEHWLVFGLGVLALAYFARRRSPLARSLGTTLGTSLLARSFSGRDGLRRLRG